MRVATQFLASCLLAVLVLVCLAAAVVGLLGLGALWAALVYGHPAPGDAVECTLLSLVVAVCASWSGNAVCELLDRGGAGGLTLQPTCTCGFRTPYEDHKPGCPVLPPRPPAGACHHGFAPASECLQCVVDADPRPTEHARALGERARELCGCWMCLRKPPRYGNHAEHPHTCLASTYLDHLLPEIQPSTMLFDVAQYQKAAKPIHICEDCPVGGRAGHGTVCPNAWRCDRECAAQLAAMDAEVERFTRRFWALRHVGGTYGDELFQLESDARRLVSECEITVCLLPAEDVAFRLRHWADCLNSALQGDDADMRGWLVAVKEALLDVARDLETAK